VYVLVSTGTPPAFCAGRHDDGRLDRGEKEEHAGYLWAVRNVVRRLPATETPSVAAVGGPAIGAGCDFALACDVRVAGAEALFGEGFVRAGPVPGNGGAWLLSRLIGEAKAKEYLLAGKDVNAETAADLGLVAEVTSEPVAAARAIAERIRELPATDVRRTDALVDSRSSFEEPCERAIDYQWECVLDPERSEAVEAFRGDRSPEYDCDYSA
jgi:2-(1,2-epoxy-1,2-dihydrophenyl)acetyl-CoA isomerase